MSETDEKPTMQLQIEPSTAQGRYASIVICNMGEHESQLTFVAEDLLAGADGAPKVGHVVSRVYIANDRIRSVAELLTRQADAIDEMRKTDAS